MATEDDDKDTQRSSLQDEQKEKNVSEPLKGEAQDVQDTRGDKEKTSGSHKTDALVLKDQELVETKDKGATLLNEDQELVDDPESVLMAADDSLEGKAEDHVSEPVEPSQTAHDQHDEKADSRQKRKEEKQAAEKEAIEKSDYPFKKERIRLIPIWLRLIIVAVLAGFFLMTGLIIGFGVIGNGDNMWDVLKPETWYNILDTIQGD